MPEVLFLRHYLVQITDRYCHFFTEKVIFQFYLYQIIIKTLQKHLFYWVFENIPLVFYLY